ncbi:MAG: phosphohydrolase [Bacteroidetes bacterium]|nr:MAG: phosphohydrolase [Bacteroidota bacterium]
MKHSYYSLMILFVFAFTANAQNDIKLEFNRKGEFKIVQFTDTHIDLESNSNLSVYETIKKVIEIEKPDFVILTGDNVTQNNPQEAYQRFSEIFKEANVPWAAVFGNHDSQHNFSRVELAEFLHKLPFCMNNDKGESYGNSNFVLPVYGKNKKTEAILYFMDSNSRSTLEPTVGGYGWFDFSQINWYRNKSKEYTLANNGNSLPALAFFHIPLPEYTQAWNNKENPPIGVKNEDECSPDINSGMFTAMLECGDIMGTFVGHDHINDYIGVYYNIALAYGRITKEMRNPAEDPIAGGRVIVLKEGKRQFNTWIRNLNGKQELNCTWPDSFTSENKNK